MKDFVNDYKNLCKESMGFYKKHWKGMLLVNAVLIGAEVAWLAYQNKKFERSISGLNKEDEVQK